jgi:hypothetical protein
MNERVVQVNSEFQEMNVELRNLLKEKEDELELLKTTSENEILKINAELNLKKSK